MATSTKGICVRDEHSRELRPLIYIPPTLSSQKASWEGVKFVLYRSVAYENQAYESHAPMVVLKLGGSPIREQIWGDGRLVVQRRTYPREIVVVPPGTYPASRTRGSMDFAIVEISPKIMAEAARELVPMGHVELVHHWGGYNPPVEQLILAFKAELEAGCPGGNLYVESLATALAISLLKHYAVSRPLIRAYRGGLPPHRLKRVTEFIQGNLDKSLSLAELAELTGMSKAYFTIAFKRSTGLTPHQYVLECRINQAHQLLDHSDLSLSDIAARLGFSSQSHFTAVFRRRTGVTPRAFRDAPERMRAVNAPAVSGERSPRPLSEREGIA
jgi:AraC family transcriptional regulator